jgi:hypothetical protein
MTTRTLRKLKIDGLQIWENWLEPLPRNASPTNIDMALHNRHGDRLLIAEFKQPGELIPAGQQEALDWFSRRGAVVWPVPEDTDPSYLSDRVHEWWNQ